MVVVWKHLDNQNEKASQKTLADSYSYNTIIHSILLCLVCISHLQGSESSDHQNKRIIVTVGLI